MVTRAGLRITKLTVKGKTILECSKVSLGYSSAREIWERDYSDLILKNKMLTVQCLGNKMFLLSQDVPLAPVPFELHIILATWKTYFTSKKNYYSATVL